MAIYRPLERVLVGTLQGAIADLLAQAVPSDTALPIVAPDDTTSLQQGSAISASPAGAAMGADLADGFSVAFWARRNIGTNAEYCGAASNGSWVNNWGFDHFSRTGSTFWVNSWNGATRVTGDSPPLNTWVHHVGTYDGDRMEIWQNGAFKTGLDSVSITSTSPLGNMTINGVGGFSSGGGACQIDECGFFNRALGAGEIALLATGVAVDSVSGCIHRWALPSGEDLVGELDLS